MAGSARKMIVALTAAALLLPVSGSAATRRKPIDPSYKMPPLTNAQIDDALQIGGTDVDAKKTRSRMTVAATVNGKGPYRFVVDSGADSTVIGARIAQTLALPQGSPVLLNGMTDSTRVFRVLVDELGLGTTTIRNLELPVLKERDLGGDGMVGIDALVQQRLMMDFEKRVIKVEDATVPEPRIDGEIIVTARRRRGQLILTQVSANRQVVDAVVDTGSEITIGNIALRNKIIRNDPSKVVTVAVTGVTGVTVNLQLARIAELKIGSITLRDVPIAFADVPPFEVFGLDKQPSLLLGTDILENFRRISLDFRARRVRFQLKRCGTTGIVLTTSYSVQLTRMSSENGQVCRP
ncbi:MAG TPA: aspartyl protease family protein [Sphingomonas sp.]|nr:aspartyl protease family protein [Sphingomonas sp.]